MAVSTENLPHDLELVIDFVNTLDREAGADELAEPRALADWLRRQELIEADAPQVGVSEHERAIALREALREVMHAHSAGVAPDPQASAQLERAAERGRLSVSFLADGSVSLRPRATGIDGALARLLAAVAESAADGSWERVKTCAADSCRWAFFDRSRNRSGRWCDMSICGNRTKVRAYRTKRAASDGITDSR